MTVEIYKIISITGFILAAVMFVLSIFIFIKLNIPKVIGDITGKTARKAIQSIREQNSQTGNKAYKSSPVNIKRGKLTEKISSSGRLITNDNDPIKVNVGTEKINTQKLSDQNQTTILYADSADTTVLDIAQANMTIPESEVQPDLELDITFIHTDEVIL